MKITLEIPGKMRIGEAIMKAGWKAVKQDVKRKHLRFDFMSVLTKSYRLGRVLNSIEDQDLLSLLEKL